MSDARFEVVVAVLVLIEDVALTCWKGEAGLDGVADLA